MDESRITIGRQLASDDALARLADRGPSRPGAFVGRTVVQSSYPTAPGVLYAVNVVDISGTEVEAGSVSTTVGSKISYAYNCGSAIPPVGTDVLIHPVPVGRLVFRYDG